MNIAVQGYCNSLPPAVLNARWPSEISSTVWSTMSAICKIGYIGGSDGPPNATCTPGNGSVPGAGIWQHTHGDCVGKDCSKFSILTLHFILPAVLSSPTRKIYHSSSLSLCNTIKKKKIFPQLCLLLLIRFPSFLNPSNSQHWD